MRSRVSKPDAKNLPPTPQGDGPPRIFVLTAYGDAYTTCLNNALQRAGHEVIRAPWSGKWLLKSMRSVDLAVLHWPSYLYHDTKSRVRTALGLLRMSIVLALLRLRGVRIIWIAHNLYPHDGGKSLLSHRLGRWVVTRLAWRIGVHSRYASNVVQSEFSVPANKIVLIEHGNWIGYYRDDIARSDARQRLGIPADTYLYLFIGLCRPYKNLESLVESMGRNKDDSKLWIVGKFPSTEYFEEINGSAQQQGAGRITLRNGFIADDDMQVYLNASDCVVLPYRDILTSGAAMLALSFGKPVVAPRLGGMPEVIVDECGVLYDADSPNGLLEAMHKARARRYDQAQIRAIADNFSWDRSAAALAANIPDASPR